MQLSLILLTIVVFRRVYTIRNRVCNLLSVCYFYGHATSVAFQLRYAMYVLSLLHTYVDSAWSVEKDVYMMDFILITPVTLYE